MSERNPAWHRAPLLAAAILLCEYLLLSFRYDALPALARVGDVAWLGHLGGLAPLAVVFAALAPVLFGTRLLASWRRLTVQLGEPQWRPPWLAGHFATYALFLGVTDRLFGQSQVIEDARLWIAAWLLLGVALIGTLGLSFVKAAVWRAFLKEARPALAWGALVAIAAWGAGFLSIQMWQSLSTVTLYAVAFVLQWIVPDLVFDPITAEVGSQRFYVTVAPICSGYEGIGLTTVFLSAYLLTARDSMRFPNAFVLLPIGIVAVLAGNVLRIAALILVGLHISPDIALGGFHSKAGWLFFCAIALGIVAWSRHASWLSRETNAGKGTDNTVAPYVVPLLAVIATALATGLFASGFDRAYFLRVLAGGVALWVYRERIQPDPSWRVSLEAAGVGALVFVLWLALSPETNTDLHESHGDLLAGLHPVERSAWIFFKLIGSILVIPIVEERAFRGYLLRRMVNADFVSVPWQRRSWLAVAGTSVAFGALHQEWIAGTAAGVLFAVLQTRRGSLGEAVFAHAVSNALIAVWALAFGRMDLWI